MNSFAVRSVEIRVEAGKAFKYISDPNNLPFWTHAFSKVGGEKAIMRTPKGETEVGLSVRASKGSGTVDWEMRFPDGGKAGAFSRVVESQPGVTVYSFILPPPPLPLEQLEGALNEQAVILEKELAALKKILESSEKSVKE